MNLKRLTLLLALVFLFSVPVLHSVAQASEPVFAFEGFAQSFNAVHAEQSSVGLPETPFTPFTQAGGHPQAMSTEFVFNHKVLKEEAVNEFGEVLPSEVDTFGEPKNVEVDLPRGMIADPQATDARCTEAQLEDEHDCPPSSAVGRLTAYTAGFPYRAPAALYDMVPPAGVPAQFGANLAGLGIIVHIDGEVRTGGDYGLSASVTNILRVSPVYSVDATIWGDPSSSSHDAQRGYCAGAGPLQQAYEREHPKGESQFECPLKPLEVSETAFLSMPTSCTGEPLLSSVLVESWQDERIATEASSPALTGCEKLQFEPTIESQPETSTASSPTGLEFDLHVSQEGKLSGLATANLKNAVVTLPEGMTLNPSSADGLAGCPLLTGKEPDKEARERKDEERGINLESTAPPNCPNASKLGEVDVTTPLLEKPLPGSIYLAEQTRNPFGSVLAIYIAIDDPERGVVVKLAGHVELGGQEGAAGLAPGQIRTTFEENPELPFEDFRLHFFGGSRAPLTTPATCGTYTTQSTLEPWSHEPAPGEPQGTPDASPSGSFELNDGPGGAACPITPAEEPNSPSFQAGTLIPAAAAFSPFVLHLYHQYDGSQPLRALDVTLPPGLTGRLAGIAQCPQSGIEQAEGRSGDGQGRLEQEDSSCPDASEVGTVQVGAGSGTPLYVSGHAYLAGPYEGAPFSLAIITPAIAGPFDLGAVVVRAGLYINPETAQVTVKSTIPTIVHGIPLDIRSIAVDMSRPGFTLNPTSCEELPITGTAFGESTEAPLFELFKANGCQTLPFAPKLTASVGAHASKLDGTSFNVRLESAGIGQANIHKVDLQLPIALPSRLTTLQKACLAAVFNANPSSCGPESVIGKATIHTPLLNSPLTGPAYLVSHGGAEFPDVEFVLQGEGVTLILDGKTDIKHGITYSKFETAPDAPFTTFETQLPAGPHSILAANAPKNPYDLCGANLQMPTEITGQNGAVLRDTTTIATPGCPPTLAITKTTVTGDTLHVTVKLNEAGTLKITGSALLKSTTKKALKAGTHTITVPLTPAGETAKRHHRKITIHAVETAGGRTGTATTALKT